MQFPDKKYQSEGVQERKLRHSKQLPSPLIIFSPTLKDGLRIGTDWPQSLRFDYVLNLHLSVRFFPVQECRCCYNCLHWYWLEKCENTPTCVQMTTYHENIKESSCFTDSQTNHLWLLTLQTLAEIIAIKIPKVNILNYSQTIKQVQKV